MGLDQAMIVAGVGCRKGAPALDVEAAIRAALTQAGVASGTLDCIATVAAKAEEAGIAAAAAKFGLAVLLISDEALRAASGRTVTRSERVQALTGVPSVAEAAALAAAGPSSRLISSRLVVGTATCALAASDASP
jgi:cobalt-precorrin 5A hydrolase